MAPACKARRLLAFLKYQEHCGILNPLLMKRYFKTICAALLLIACQAVYAQTYQSIEGTTLKELKPADVAGSPFLNDEWARGTVTTDRTRYHNLKLKYDLSHDQVIFAGANDQPTAFAEHVNKFTIDTMVFASGFPAAGLQRQDAYYQVLADGRVKLLKHDARIIRENKAYGMATVTREFRDVMVYYVFKNGEMIAVKPDKKDITAILVDKSAAISSYLHSHKINFRDDADLSALFNYYNGLN